MVFHHRPVSDPHAVAARGQLPFDLVAHQRADVVRLPDRLAVHDFSLDRLHSCRSYRMRTGFQMIHERSRGGFIRSITSKMWSGLDVIDTFSHLLKAS